MQNAGYNGARTVDKKFLVRPRLPNIRIYFYVLTFKLFFVSVKISFRKIYSVGLNVWFLLIADSLYGICISDYTYEVAKLGL